MASKTACVIGGGLVLLLAASFQITRAGAAASRLEASADANPYALQVAEQIARLKADKPEERAAAAEALGYLRAYSAAEELESVLEDRHADVRQEAAMALGWCGGRAQVAALIKTLGDERWPVRQAANVALNNITGMELEFNALAEPAILTRQQQAWRTWWGAAADEDCPLDTKALLASADLEEQLRAVRALGALGGPADGGAILALLEPYLEVEYESLDPTQRHLAQAALRSLGRLRTPEALPVLIGLLERAPWGRFAASALGDFGSAEAVAPMIAVYPRYSRDLDKRTKRSELCPTDDCFSADNTQDRMFETPYALAEALTRLPLGESDVAKLREITPYVLANIPSDWDGGMLYEPEAFEAVTAALLDRSGLRDTACEEAFEALGRSAKWFTSKPAPVAGQTLAPGETFQRLAMKVHGDVPYVGPWLPALCAQERYVPRLLSSLEHENGWISINATKALIFAQAQQAVEPIAKLLARSHAEAEYGFSGVLEHAEYEDAAPRRREAFIRALGRLQAVQYDGLLIKLLEDERNVVDMRYAAALALDELGTARALEALEKAEASHPFHSVRLAAREALWRRGMLADPGALEHPAGEDAPAEVAAATEAPAEPSSYVFIRGDNVMRSDFNAQSGLDPWRQTYTVNNPAPTARVGRDLFILNLEGGRKRVRRLTHFESGFVADCEVSWDGKRIIFAHRRDGESRNYSQAPHSAASLRKPGALQLDGPNDPWWHLWEVNVDGSGLRQLTHGPFHDVHPAYLPDGRIVASSTRLGLRDEYHGYPATGLAVMDRDGGDIRVIGFNLGADREPSILPDGRILFSRLDVFYSRFKSEVTLQAVYPDGSKNVVLYGPERRAYWQDVHRDNAAWTMRSAFGGGSDNRNRVLRMNQAQSLGDGRIVATSSGGLVVVGPGTAEERLVPHDRKYAVTSPFPIDGKRVIAAATRRQFRIGDRTIDAGTEEFRKLKKGPELFQSAVNIDLGLYFIDLDSGAMEPLYNDPEFAEFEARPLVARTPPRRAPDVPNTVRQGYTAKLFAASVFHSRHERVRTRGKLLRVIEGQPFVSRHESQKSAVVSSENRWKNHGGTHARVLGTVPLAADGSFFIEAPADRLLQLQVLDSDRQVLGNQTFWMYARPGETRGCVGCHEPADSSTPSASVSLAVQRAALETLPRGGEFSYRAKTWLKGVLPDETEERSRTVRAVNLMGRH